MKLFSKNSNLYDHDTSQTDGQLALAIPRSATLRAVKHTQSLADLLNARRNIALHKGLVVDSFVVQWS